MSSPFIIIDELTDKINELNSELSSSIDSINANINAISTDLTEVAANVSINNTASSTGTLSQKLTSIYNQIGSTTSTNGSSSEGSLMAKLNALLDISSGKYTTKTASQSGKTSDTTFISLSNVILIGAKIGTKGYAGDYGSVCELEIDGNDVLHSSSSASAYYYVNTGSSVTSIFQRNLPCYCETLKVHGYGDSSNTSRNTQTATIYYIQL